MLLILTAYLGATVLTFVVISLIFVYSKNKLDKLRLYDHAELFYYAIALSIFWPLSIIFMVLLLIYQTIAYLFKDV